MRLDIDKNMKNKRIKLIYVMKFTLTEIILINCSIKLKNLNYNIFKYEVDVLLINLKKIIGINLMLIKYNKL